MPDTVNVGTAADNNTGDRLRAAFQLINQKFVAVQAGMSEEGNEIVARVEAARDGADASAAAAEAQIASERSFFPTVGPTFSIRRVSKEFPLSLSLNAAWTAS